jgi:hypothetical protein
MNCIAAMITTAYHGFVNESLVIKCNIKSEPCIENETHVREAEGILKIEVPDNLRKIVIVKGDNKMDMEI